MFSSFFLKNFPKKKKNNIIWRTLYLRSQPQLDRSSICFAVEGKHKCLWFEFKFLLFFLFGKKENEKKETKIVYILKGEGGEWLLHLLPIAAVAINLQVLFCLQILESFSFNLFSIFFWLFFFCFCFCLTIKLTNV